VCPQCRGLGLATPADLKTLADELELVAAGAPPARPELDQTHCTTATKIHRVLKMAESGALDGSKIIMLGDDDLISVAIARFAKLTGVGVKAVTVIDTDPAVLDWIGHQAAGADVTLIEHDLREPLPAGLTGSFDVACTDPPYTVQGAGLFLSRAVAALRPRPGQQVFFSFGARRPADTLATQRLITELGLVVRSLTPNFNRYLGAGILGSSSHLYHLRSTEQTRPLRDADFAVPLYTGPLYTGPLYTADMRTDQTRPYRCAGCGAVHTVGGGTRWAGVTELKAARCPACGGSTFRPMPRGRA